MAHVQGWMDLSGAVQDANKAKLAAFDGKPSNEVLLSVAFAIMRQAAGTRDALESLHERIERLHHKIYRMEKNRP